MITNINVVVHMLLLECVVEIGSFALLGFIYLVIVAFFNNFSFTLVWLGWLALTYFCPFMVIWFVIIKKEEIVNPILV